MSLWSRITEAVRALSSGEALANLFDRLRTPPERSVGFAIAVIALGAKMAKADGVVSRDEVAAFREVFTIPKRGEESAARIFNLARQDVAGYDEYARRIVRMIGKGKPALSDLLEGLFHIAMADGEYHPDEAVFLETVSEIFGIEFQDFKRIRAAAGAHSGEVDPYAVLGIPHKASLDEAREAWRALVRESHPDRLIARGLPEEAVRLAEKRLIAANLAWEEISHSY